MAGNKGSGRRAVIDMRPDKNEIVKMIIKRELKTPDSIPYGDIAKRIGVDFSTVQRYREEKITEEMRRKVMADLRVEDVESDTAILNDERMDVGRTYDSLARRVEKLITKAEENEDDGFALAAMEGLRKILRDIATMHGKMAQDLTVTQSLATSPEWVTLKAVLQAVCDEVPEAREPLLRQMRHHVLSVTKEGSVL
jgi:DNA-binding transcriptional regulator YhcF (GntR family)